MSSQKELIENLNEIKNQKDTKLIPENIKSGINVLGVEGSYLKEVDLFNSASELENTEPESNMLALVYNKEENDLEGIYASTELSEKSYIISNQGNKIYLPVYTNIWDSESCNGSSYLADFIEHDSIIKVITKDENNRLLTGEIYPHARKGYFIGDDGYLNIFVDLDPLVKRMITVNWDLQKIYRTDYKNVTPSGLYTQSDFMNTDELLSASTCYTDENKTEISIEPSTWKYDLDYEKVYEPLDTSAGTVQPEDIISGKIAYSQGLTVEGTMLDNDYLYYTPSAESQTIPAGYTKGGTVWGDSDLIADNIKKGASIFNVEGTYSGLDTTDATAIASDIIQGKTAYVQDIKIEGTMKDHGTVDITPSTIDQIIEDGHITKVLVIGDPNLLPENIKLGTTMFGIEGTLDTEFDTSDATATVADILYGKTAYLADGTLATGTMPNGGAIYGHKFREWGHNANQTYLSMYPTKGYYNGSTHTAALYIPLKSKWTSATDEDKRFINELFAELGITADILKAGTWLYTLSGTYTADGTATAGDLVAGKIAYVNGEQIIGTLETETPIDNISSTATEVSIPADDINSLTMSGLAEANGVVTEDTPVQVKASNEQVATAIGLAPDLLKAGTNILGIEGTLGSEEAEFNAKLELPEGATDTVGITKMLTSISSLNTSGLTNASSLLSGCSSLKSLPEMDLDQVTNAYRVFADCSNLTYMPNIDLNKSANMAYAFANCSNISYFNVIMPNVSTNLAGVFENCYSMKTLPNINFKSLNQSYGYGHMYNMCANCTNLTEVDLGGITTYARYGHSFGCAFYNCTNLKTFRGLSSSAIQQAYECSYGSMFYNCTNLQYVNDFKLYTPLAGAMFDNCTNLISLNNVSTTPTWNGVIGSAMFRNCYNLTNISSLANTTWGLNANGVHNIFANCKSLQFPDPVYFNFCNSKYSLSSHNIFAGCESVTDLYVIGINKPNGTHYAYNWFANCKSLTNLTIENFRAYLVNAFAGCDNLQAVNFINTTYDYVSMFRNSGITNVANSVISNGELVLNRLLTNNQYADCYKLTEIGTIDLGCNYSYDAFHNCYSLNNLDGANFYNAQGLINMFRNCNSLTQVNHITSWSDGSTVVTNMFAGCTNLIYVQALDLSNYLGSSYSVAPFGVYSEAINSNIPLLNNLTHFGGFTNIGNKYSYVSSANYYSSVDIVPAINLTYESILNVTTNLCNMYTVFNVTELAENSMPVIRLEINQYNKLSETDITNIANLGWKLQIETIPAAEGAE